jgi:hypothetical protein
MAPAVAAMSDMLNQSLRFRNYAEILRLIAADKSSAQTRRTLLKIAAEYDRMAQDLEELGGGGGKGGQG